MRRTINPANVGGMKLKWLNPIRAAGIATVALCVVVANVKLIGQGLLVDQASGTLSEFVPNGVIVPDNQIAQSFTPSLSAVGFVQFSDLISDNSSSVVVVVNLRQGAYNGAIVSSTDPIVLFNKFTQISTFYFPDNIAVTPGRLYFFEPVLQSSGHLDFGYKSPSTYDRGDLFGNGVPSGGAADLWFREGIVVPEPSSIWFLVLASLGLICRRIARQ